MAEWDRLLLVFSAIPNKDFPIGNLAKLGREPHVFRAEHVYYTEGLFGSLGEPSVDLTACKCGNRHGRNPLTAPVALAIQPLCARNRGPDPDLDVLFLYE